MKRKAVIVVGLGFGDEGKGSLVDAIVRREGAWLVTRYNGGPQAAHHVVTPEGVVHCFAQYGAGTFAGADTYLSPYMAVDPFALKREGLALKHLNVLKDVTDSMHIDLRCPIVTPLHVAMNKARETAREHRHGSCGRGVGEMRAFDVKFPMLTLRVKDLQNEGETYRKLRAYVDLIADEWDELGASEFLMLPTSLTAEGFKPTTKTAAELLAYAYAVWARNWQQTFTPRMTFGDEPVVFEGAQGVLLDEWHGFHPHTTWATTTTQHAHDLLADCPYGDVERKTVGVLRTFATRHGHGPFPTEGKLLPGAFLKDDHNTTGAWQGPMRIGAFDAVLAKYAIAATGGVDCLALTHMDKVTDTGWPLVVDYSAHQLVPTDGRDDAKLAWQEALGRHLSIQRDQVILMADREQMTATIEDYVGRPVGIVSDGPTHERKVFTPAYDAAPVSA